MYFGLFIFLFFIGMVVSGAATYDQEQHEHGSQEQVSVISYLTTGDFVEAMFENWESEFLQMGMYVVLTAFLYQKGSSESKPITRRRPQDQDPRDVTPSRGRRGRYARGLVLVIYEHSLAIAFFALFFASMALHAIGGVKAFNEEQLQHGEAAISVWRYVDHVAVLVRVDAELAERVHRRRRHHRPVDLPAAARLGRIQAGRRTASAHQLLSGLFGFLGRRLRPDALMRGQQ